jgi:hypothetical protein
VRWLKAQPSRLTAGAPAGCSLEKRVEPKTASFGVREFSEMGLTHLIGITSSLIAFDEDGTELQLKWGYEGRKYALPSNGTDKYHSRSHHLCSGIHVIFPINIAVRVVEQCR